MDHLSLLQEERNNDKTVHAKSLVSRALGRFYTPALISNELIEGVIHHAPQVLRGTIKVIDPFCGDGRLITTLLNILHQNELNPQLEIHFWDRDGDALNLAIDNISECLDNTRIDAKICPWEGNTFKRALGHFSQYDILVTNPPWETLKPDRRELELLSNEDRIEYKKKLKLEDQWFTENYPTSQPIKKLYGWGTNLAKVGVELSLRLISNEGICGIVSPVSLFADQTSGTLRRWMFNNYQIKSISYYPAEARLFKKVDQPTAAFIAIPGINESQKICMTVYNAGKHVVQQDWITFKDQELKKDDYSIPLLYGPKWIKILSKLRDFPTFKDLEGDNESDLWAGRELDETGRQRFLTCNGEYPFIKGIMTRRYGIKIKPDSFIKTDVVNVPNSAYHQRLVWRDVSRPTQMRRIQATLIPSGWVSGNSLHVAYFKNDDEVRLLGLLAVVNSLVFEIQVRAMLATSHISLGIVRNTHIPNFNNIEQITKLAQLAVRCLNDDEDAKIEVEVLVAKNYNLTKQEFKFILDQFDKIPTEQKKQLLSSRLWSENIYREETLNV